MRRCWALVPLALGFLALGFLALGFLVLGLVLLLVLPLVPPLVPPLVLALVLLPMELALVLLPMVRLEAFRSPLKRQTKTNHVQNNSKKRGKVGTRTNKEPTKNLHRYLY